MRVGFPILILAFFAALVYVTWHLWRITPGGWPAKVLVTGLFLFWMALAFVNMPLSEKVSVRAAQRQYADQAHRFTFVTFNTVAPNVKTVIDDAPIGEVKDLTEADYIPSACTPLFDAMGMAITALGRKVKEGDRVLVTVITDGMENASQEYSGRAIKEMVSRLREKGWTFVYIGANQDAVEVAKGLDIHNSMDFEASDLGTTAMWDRHRRSQEIYYSKVMHQKERMLHDEDFFNEKAMAARITPERFRRILTR